MSFKARLLERLLTLRGLPSDSSCVLEAEPGKLDISLQVGLLFKLAITTSLSSFVSIQCHCDVIQKVQCHDDLIKARAMR